MVPKGWKEGKVKDLVKSLDAGISVNSEDDGNTNSEFKILKTSCVSNGVFQLEKAKSVVEPNEISRLKEPVKADSIIISRMNTPALVGANGYVENEITNTFLPDRLWQVKPRDNKVNMKWLGYWFSSSHTRYALSSTATGTSGSMKNITKPDVLNIKIDIPPLPEQQKIAKILSTWDKAISTTERLIENSIQQKKALMQQLLTGKKRLLDESGKRFDGEWEERKLSNLGSTFNGLTGKTKVDFGSGKKYIPYMNIFKNTFIDTDNLDYVNIDVDEKQNTVQFGDVFFTTSSETPEEVGMSSILLKKTKEPIYLNSFCFGFRLFEIDKVAPAFIGYILRSSHVRRKIAILAQGATRYNLSKVQLLKISIALPSLEEQQKIATVLTNADREIELLEQQLADLQQEKKALMQVLLTGKKRVVVDGES